MLTQLSWIAFGLGAFICAGNFYLSFIRYPLHRLCGRSRESYRWVSGIPLFGSLFVALSLLQLCATPWLLPAGVVLILADTGGVHWFIGTMIYHSWHDNTNS